MKKLIAGLLCFLQVSAQASLLKPEVNSLINTTGTGLFLRKDGTNSPPTGEFILNPAFQINPNDAATIGQITSIQIAGSWKQTGVVAATTVALPTNVYSIPAKTLTASSTGALPAIDGVTLSAGMDLLVKNEVSTLKDGIYTVTDPGAAGVKYILTRRTDADTTAELSPASVSVSSGTVNAGTSWTQTFATPVLGVDPIIWSPLGVTYFADGLGLHLTGNTFGIVLADTTLSQTVAGLKVNQTTLNGIYADVHLDNLSAPTAVNVDLYPGIDNTTLLGKVGSRWYAGAFGDGGLMSSGDIVPEVDNTPSLGSAFNRWNKVSVGTNGVSSAGNVVPEVNDTPTLGDSTHRWNKIFAGTNGIRSNGNVSPETTNTVTVGDTTHRWNKVWVGSLGVQSSGPVQTDQPAIGSAFGFAAGQGSVGGGAGGDFTAGNGTVTSRGGWVRAGDALNGNGGDLIAGTSNGSGNGGTVWSGDCNGSGCTPGPFISGSNFSATGNGGDFQAGTGAGAGRSGSFLTDATGYFEGGEYHLLGSTSGTLTLKPAAITTPHTLTMPAAQGASGAVLTNNGSGALSWTVPAGGGTVTSVSSANSDLSVASPTTTPVLTINSAPKWDTARLLAGNSVDGTTNVPFANKFIVQGTTDSGLSNAQFMGALATGIVKNTTTTGVQSIAIAADFPTLNQNTTGTCSNVTGVVAFANGGTGQTTQGAAMTALAGSASSGQYLRGNGTNVVMSAIQVADVPTLNQNTTGTASNVTGTVAIANGGTGQTTQAAAITALAGAQTSGQYLRSNGTNTLLAAIQAIDVPTLNQSTTGSAGTLSPGRNINGVLFNGSSNITVTADASTLTGTTLNSTVVNSSLTSIGTLAFNGLKINNPAATFAYTITGSAITAARQLNLPLTTQTETLAVQPQILQATPADPATTTSLVGLMMGLNQTITPRVTGRVLIIISGDIDNLTAADGAQVQIRTGTGAAPANGAALTGTVAGGLVKHTNTAPGTVITRAPFSLNAIVSGLTVGTTAWIDVGLAAITGGTARIRDLSVTAQEL